jgi:hypothetical protein
LPLRLGATAPYANRSHQTNPVSRKCLGNDADTKLLVETEMSLHVLAYNLKRMISILGVRPLLKALEA